MNKRCFLLILIGLFISVFLNYRSLSVSLLDMTGVMIENSIPGYTDEQLLFCNKESSATVIFKDPAPLEPFEACFLSAIFGMSPKQSDKPLDAGPWKEQLPTFGFFLYTNLVDLETPGWHKVLFYNTDLKRMVTESRYPKFLGWKHEIIEKYCPVVYYLDGAIMPQASLETFRTQNQLIQQSSSGLSQMKHWFDLRQELKAIVEIRKDIQSNVDLTRAWLEKQPDFSYDCQLYQNTFIGYDPKNPNFRKAAEFFWNQYSKETESWRDQPLWCYTLHHFNMTPIPMKNMIKNLPFKMGGRLGRHMYNVDTNNEAEVFLNMTRKKVCSNSEDNVSQAKGDISAQTPPLHPWEICTAVSDEDRAELKKEIAQYEQSARFRDKINEVKGTRKVALHHASIDAYLKQSVLRPGWSVLELGCAAGAMLQMVKRAYDGGIGEHKELVGVELVTGWVNFAKEYFVDKGIHVYEGDITDFHLPAPFEKKTFDFVMLNDVAEHIQKHRYRCFFRKLRDVTHEGSIVYFHTPNPQAQLKDADQFYENVLPHHVVVSGMASSNFELVTFEQDVGTNCGSGVGSNLPTNVLATKCSMNGYTKYYHAVFRRVDSKPIFKLQ